MYFIPADKVIQDARHALTIQGNVVPLLIMTFLTIAFYVLTVKRHGY